jgi:hypothetical protein
VSDAALSGARVAMIDVREADLSDPAQAGRSVSAPICTFPAQPAI